MLNKIKIKNKKAVSNVIAYVLLIVIALSIGGFVVYSLSKMIPEERDKCPADVKLIIESYNYESNILSAIINNYGLFDVDGFFVHANNRTEGLHKINLAKLSPYNSENISHKLKPGESFEFGTVDVSVHNQIISIEIEPYIINKKGEIILCDSSIIKQSIFESAVEEEPPACTNECSIVGEIETLSCRDSNTLQLKKCEMQEDGCTDWIEYNINCGTPDSSCSDETSSCEEIAGQTLCKIKVNINDDAEINNWKRSTGSNSHAYHIKNTPDDFLYLEEINGGEITETEEFNFKICSIPNFEYVKKINVQTRAKYGGSDNDGDGNVDVEDAYISVDLYSDINEEIYPSDTYKNLTSSFDYIDGLNETDLNLEGGLGEISFEGYLWVSDDYCHEINGGDEECLDSEGYLYMEYIYFETYYIPQIV